MDNEKIAGHTHKEWAEIWKLPKFDSERQHKEGELIKYIEEHPEDKRALVIGIEIVLDVYKRNEYFKKFIEYTRVNKSLADYLFAIHLSRVDERKEQAETLLAELKQEYPIRGRIADALVRAYRSYP